MSQDQIFIHFESAEIKEYINIKKKLESLLINNYKFEIVKTYCSDITDYLYPADISDVEKINILFDFFIKHKCFFHVSAGFLYNIDINLFLKSGYWFLNSDKYWIIDPLIRDASLYFFLAKKENFIKLIDMEYTKLIIPLYLDIPLSVLDLKIKEFKEEMSQINYKKFIKIFLENIIRNLKHVLQYDIDFFKIMHKYDILNSFIKNISSPSSSCIIDYYFKQGKTEIIDYLIGAGFNKSNIKIYNEYSLIDIIKNDNIETFNYIIKNIDVSDEIIKEMIKKSGSFITKEYVEVLFNNGKLELDNLKLLENSIKNNPDKKLKSYVKKLKLK